MRCLTPLLLLLLTHAVAAETRLLRFPDVHNDRVVFVHAGDLYTAPLTGGTAVRLTSHPGAELYPKFSPDGSWIAFSAEYNGTRQVYVMPATGGEPRQLTWYNDVGEMPVRGGTDNRVLDWMPDGVDIIVRMNRTPFDQRSGRPYRVPFAGGMEMPMPMLESGGGSISPDGTRFAYTPIDRDFRSWKRYRGGRAQDVWVYDLTANTSLRLTDSLATDQQPMWVGDEVYFVSDRNHGMLNLFSIAASGGAAVQRTAFADFDVLWPSAGPGGIVFEKGGGLWHYDPATGGQHEIPIDIAVDFAETRPRYVDAAQFIDSFALSPGGERVLIAARGEVFSIPAKNGATRNLTRTPDAREHSVSWSPDGRWVLYLSDASGEHEIWRRAQDGHGEPERLTQGGDEGTWRFPPVWSPDSTRIAFADKRQRLRVLDPASGEISEADVATHADILDYSWSPDSRWLAYSKINASQNSSIWLYSLDTQEAEQLTPDETRERNPVFDPKGRFLYFFSDRDYALSFSAFEFNYLYRDATRIFAATLAADAEVVYPPKSDEPKVPTSTKKAKKKTATDDAPQLLKIDVPGFNRRVVALKAPAGDYLGLSANSKGVFYAVTASGPEGELRYLALDADKPAVVATMSGYALSADGKRLLLRRGAAFSVVDAKASAEFTEGAVDLSGLQLRIEPPREWRQLFVDAWRILRDHFYDPGMHGQDWNAIRAKYEPLLTDVHSRQDLDYLLHEIAGEANAGHVYVERGDEPRVARRAGGLLGAEWSMDSSGYPRIKRIYAGENWDPLRRSPLTEPGVEVAEGDFLLEVDGVSAHGIDNIYRLFENTADHWVTLRVAPRPEESAGREVRVKPLASELPLRYLDWVQGNRRRVEQLSQGRIGYIHLPNTANEGNQELFRGMLAYAAREALIIDDRYNGGGFIPDRMIELLGRRPLNYWKRRGLFPSASPLLSHRGPKAMLINGLSGSGGDALPYYFRNLKLGPLIGTRTWGGLIGIDGGSNPRLADGGAVLSASFRFLDTHGQWAVEDEGVSPDIEVIDRPELLAAGRDPSLEAAVEHLMAEIERSPQAAPAAPNAPTTFPRDQTAP